jgi:hypothetical protein
VERRNIYRVLVKKPQGDTPLGTLKYRLEDDIKMYFNSTL